MKTMGLAILGLLLAACQNPASSSGNAPTSSGPPYTVTYKNTTVNTTGTVPVDHTAYQLGDTVPVKGNTGNLSWPPFTWIGWNTQDNNANGGGGGGTSYSPGATFTIQSNVVLYGTWTP